MDSSLLLTIGLFTLYLTAYVSSADTESDPEEICSQGHLYRDNCNYCICDPSTGTQKCTKMICQKPERNLCPYGETYKDECNTCWCDIATGSSACTKMGCGGFFKKGGAERKTQLCPLGIFYRIECNRCRCDPKTGNEACTKISCSGLRPY